MTTTHRYIADTHFGCSAEFLKMAGRPFESPEEHDATIIGNISSALDDGCEVWIVGDCFDTHTNTDTIHELFAAVEPCKREHLHLICGNHDGATVTALKSRDMLNYRDDNPAGVFDTVFPAAMLADDGRQVLLLHYPIAVPYPDQGFAIYGHIHDGLKRDGSESSYTRYIQAIESNLNASADITGFKPLTIDELIEVNRDWRVGSIKPPKRANR